MLSVTVMSRATGVDCRLCPNVLWQNIRELIGKRMIAHKAYLSVEKTDPDGFSFKGIIVMDADVFALAK